MYHQRLQITVSPPGGQLLRTPSGHSNSVSEFYWGESDIVLCRCSGWSGNHGRRTFRAGAFSAICTQLIHYYPDVGAQYIVSLPDNATEESWFLWLLLQKISDKLEPHQRLIIAIDALDAIDPNHPQY